MRKSMTTWPARWIWMAAGLPTEGTNAGLSHAPATSLARTCLPLDSEPAWAMCATGAGRWAGTLSWRSTKNGWFGLVCAWDRRVSRSGDAAGLASPDLERLCRSGGAGPRFRTRVGGCSAQTCPAPLANRAGSRRRGFIGSAAMQRLLAIASAFDLSGAPIGNWSNSSSLVRKS